MVRSPTMASRVASRAACLLVEVPLVREGVGKLQDLYVVERFFKDNEAVTQPRRPAIARHV